MTQGGLWVPSQEEKFCAWLWKTALITWLSKFWSFIKVPLSNVQYRNWKCPQNVSGIILPICLIDWLLVSHMMITIAKKPKEVFQYVASYCDDRTMVNYIANQELAARIIGRRTNGNQLRPIKQLLDRWKICSGSTPGMLPRSIARISSGRRMVRFLAYRIEVVQNAKCLKRHQWWVLLIASWSIDSCPIRRFLDEKTTTTSFDAQNTSITTQSMKQTAIFDPEISVSQEVRTCGLRFTLLFQHLWVPWRSDCSGELSHLLSLSSTLGHFSVGCFAEQQSSVLPRYHQDARGYSPLRMVINQ